LLELASHQHLAAALLLPLYYLADATITLFRRLANSERIWTPIGRIFINGQPTTDFRVRQVVTNVFLLNVLLAGLATASIAIPFDRR